MKHPVYSSKPWFKLAILILVLAQLTCQAVQPAATVETQEPETTAVTEEPTDVTEQPTTAPDTPAPPTEETIKPTAPPQPTSGPVTTAGDLACFGTISLGVTCLGTEGWQSFDRKNSSLNTNSVQDITSCPDGTVALVSSNGVTTFDGANWKTYAADLDAVIGAEGIACDAQNNFWVAFMSGVSHWDGAGWTTYPSESVVPGGGATTFRDVAVAADGTVWVISGETISKFDGANWTVFKEGQGLPERYFIKSLALDNQGQPWVGHSGGLLHYENETWQAYPNRDIATLNALAADSQGRIWIASNSNGVYMFESGGWIEYDLVKEAGASNHTRAIAVDARDRVWASTEYGIAVFDGAKWTAFHMHTADLIENDFRSLALVGSGPELPAQMQKSPGSLNARVLDSAGQPIANAPVEICVETLGSTYYGETPCSDQPFITKGTTDAGGNFTFTDLPAGYYVITIYAIGGWSQLVGEFGSFSERVLIRPGQSTNIGDITLQD